MPSPCAYDPKATLEDRAIRAIASSGGMVVDAGGAGRFTKGLRAYEPLFRDVDYKTLDVSAAAGPDIVGDIHDLPFADDTVDAYLCRSVLEHVSRPERAVSELHRTLRPGGRLLVSVPSVYPYHARTGDYDYPDLWRFLEDGLRELLGTFSSVEMSRSGGAATSLVMFVPPLNRRTRVFGRFAGVIDTALERRRPRHNSSMLYALASK